MATRRSVLTTLFGGMFAMAARKQAGGAPQGDVPKDKYRIRSDARARTRQLGRTGVRVSIVGLGGYHLGLPRDEQESIRIVRRALDHGLNFLDNCWDYNQGQSEERMGKAPRGGSPEGPLLMPDRDPHTSRAAREPLPHSVPAPETDNRPLV